MSPRESAMSSGQVNSSKAGRRTRGARKSCVIKEGSELQEINDMLDKKSKTENKDREESIDKVDRNQTEENT